MLMRSGLFLGITTLLGLRYCSWTSWALKMGPIRCPETSVKDYRSTLHYTPEERRSHLGICSTVGIRSLWLFYGLSYVAFFKLKMLIFCVIFDNFLLYDDIWSLDSWRSVIEKQSDMSFGWKRRSAVCLEHYNWNYLSDITRTLRHIL
jgi:hypothetical protein